MLVCSAMMVGYDAMAVLCMCAVLHRQLGWWAIMHVCSAALAAGMVHHSCAEDADALWNWSAGCDDLEDALIQQPWGDRGVLLS